MIPLADVLLEAHRLRVSDSTAGVVVPLPGAKFQLRLQSGGGMALRASWDDGHCYIETFKAVFHCRHGSLDGMHVVTGLYMGDARGLKFKCRYSSSDPENAVAIQ